MTKYSFRLQPVLNLRTANRDEQRSNLSEAIRALEAFQESRASLLAELEAHQRQVEAISSGGLLNVPRLVELQRYEQVLRIRLEELSQQETFWTEETQRRQVSLAEADREVKVLQRIDQEHRQAHRQHEEQRDVKQLDEIGLARLQFEQRYSS